MNKHFLQNLAFLLLVNLVVKPLWIGIDLSVQNAVGNEVYGRYFTLFNHAFIFHILLDFGIANFNSRAISQNSTRLHQYFPSIIVIKGVLAIVYLLCTLGSAAFLHYSGFEWHLLLFLCGNQIMLSFLLFFRSNLQGLQQFKTDSLLSVLDRVLMLLICASLLFLIALPQGFQIAWFVYAQTAAYITAALSAFFVVYKQIPQFRLNINFSLLKTILQKSYPFAILGLLMSIYNRSDALMLRHLLPSNGEVQVGIYAQSYRLLDTLNMFALLFSTLLLPMFSRLISEQNLQAVNSLAGFSGRLMYAIAIAAVVFCIVYATPLMHWLYTDIQAYNVHVFSYLITSFIAIALMYVYGTLLTANGNLKWLNSIALSSVAINIALNYYYIPSYQALGATLATVLTQSISAAAYFALAVYKLHLSISLKHTFLIIIYPFICILLSYLSMHLPFIWQINAVLGGITCLTSALLIRLVNWRRMVDFKR